MLEASLDEELELSANEFQQYMQDNWSWKRSFAMSSAKYGA